MTADTTKFELGQVVQHRTDAEKGVVTGILFRESGVTYMVVFGSGLCEKESHACELEEAVTVS